MAGTIHLVKLCVGASQVDDLINWQKSRAAQNADALPRHVTRMWPKQAEALTGGGSIYWVFKGVVLARQRILRLEPVDGQDGTRRCGIVLDPEVVPTEPQPRRPFQGWRYLRPEDAPADLSTARARSGEAPLPASLALALSEIGVR